MRKARGDKTTDCDYDLTMSRDHEVVVDLKKKENLT